MRLVPTSLAMAFLAFGSLIAANRAGRNSVSCRLVGDSVLARVLGTNGGQAGGKSASFSCDDVNSTGADQHTKDQCSALTTVNANSICVECSDNNATGYTSGSQTTIVFVGIITCSGMRQTSRCEIGVNGHGACVDFTPDGTCSGSFNQFGLQPVNGAGGPGQPTS